MEKIIINTTLTKEKDNDLFARAAMFNSGEEYLKFLFELDRRVNGRDDQINGYKTAEDKLKEKPLKTNTEMHERLSEILSELLSNIEYVTKCIPEEAKLSSIDGETGLMFIPEDDTLYSSKLLIEEAALLLKLIK